MNGAARRFTSARLGVRLARRELRRRPARTALVLLLVFLPTAVMGAAVTYVRTTERSPAEAVAAEWGRADTNAHLPDSGRPTAEELDALRTALPAGSRLLVEQQVRDRVRLGDRRTYVSVSDLALDDPVAEGRFGPLRGRLPATAREAVLSTEAARDMGVEVGETLTPDRLGTRLTVVGTVPERSGHDHIVYTRGPLPDGAESYVVVAVDLPTGTSADFLSSSVPGWTLEPVTSYGDQGDKTAAVFWSYVGGGVGLIVLGTVITAAFAVGARRQLRSVGLLSSSGASPSTVKWFLVAQGAVAGSVGSIVGVAAGVLAVRTVPGHLLTSLAGRPVDQVVARPADLLPIVVIGTLAASIAAWLPARSAARVPTLQALAGRRPLPKVPRRLPMLGALAVGGGCALLAMAVAGARDGGSSLWALVAIAGGLAVLLGAIATAPWVIAGLERASTALPRSWRLAGRSLARSRVRSSAVVGAVCAVSATLIAGATLFNSLHEPSPASRPNVRDDQVVIESRAYSPNPTAEEPGIDEARPAPASLMRRIEAIVPGGRPVRLTEVAPVGAVDYLSSQGLTANYIPRRAQEQEPQGERGYVSVGVATPELLDLLAVPGKLRAELNEGGAISVSEPPYESRSVSLPTQQTSKSVSVRLAGSFESPAAASALPGVLISSATARRLGFATKPGPTTVLSLPSPVTDRQRDQLGLLSEDLNWEQERAPERDDRQPVGYVYLSTPPEAAPVSPALIKAGVLAGALLLVLAVVAVGLALAAKDSEDERQVLTAVGAPPRTLRRTGALRAVLLVLVAGLISTPAGLLPAAAIVAAADVSDDPAPFRPDLWTVLFVVILVPALVGMITWSGGRVRDLVRPRRPDVFAFGE
ncbi:MAG: FtsX-like permease family protein [Acidimicrobiales bacterium]